MMTRIFMRVFHSLVVCVTFVTASALAQQAPPRLHAAIRNDETFHLTGAVTPILKRARDAGAAPPSLPLRMSFRFQMSEAQSQDLDFFLRQVQSRSSRNFHKFLTPEQFGQRFGPNPADVAKIKTWLEEQGFSDIEVGRSGMSIAFSGIAAQVDNAFHTALHNYQLDGKIHYANSNEPELPQALSGTIRFIRGLHDFHPKPYSKVRRLPRYEADGQHFFDPYDFTTVYGVITSLYNGNGVSIAIAGQSDIHLSDIAAFRNVAGLSGGATTVVLTGPDPGFDNGSESEADLDLEWAGAAAPAANLIYVNSQDAFESLGYAIEQDLAPIASFSFGVCETDLTVVGNAEIGDELAQADAEGITILVASGDSGPANCAGVDPSKTGLAVSEPASQPYVTAVGGTQFPTGASSWWYANLPNATASEQVWNESSAAHGLAASGGGPSIWNTKPWWQVAPGVPADGARDVPDVALPADYLKNGYLICSSVADANPCTNGYAGADGYFYVNGGTSASTQAFAGLVALLVQEYGAQGNLNPNLYSMTAQNNTLGFHDTTVGNTVISCLVGTANCATGTYGYFATPGYDLATGLGSVDFFLLAANWSRANLPVQNSQAAGLFPITPCRVVDTRDPTSLFGGELAKGETRAFNFSEGPCNLPTNVTAYVVNVTVVPEGPLGFLSVYPSDQGQPDVSTLNSDGRIKANSAIVATALNGAVSVYASNPTHLVIDVSGYFLPIVDTPGLQYYPLSPCRVLDTRSSSFIPAGSTLDVQVTGICGVPPGAQAYSVNLTAVPHGSLGYLSAWPTGQQKPESSILNAPSGTATANAAIIPAGVNGQITAFASNNSDLVVDINGYFAAPANGLWYHAISPCRVFDSRTLPAAVPLDGLTTINMLESSCSSLTEGIPAPVYGNGALVLNATVIPPGVLGFLTLWGGQSQPFASTLNADPGTITSNMAILPMNNIIINAYTSDPTVLVVDISGFFGPVSSVNAP